MPDRKTDSKSSKSPSPQAGEYVREEIEHVRQGVHGARSTKQAIAIGLSKARRAGVKLPPQPGKKAPKATGRKPNPKALRARPLRHWSGKAAQRPRMKGLAPGPRQCAAAWWRKPEQGRPKSRAHQGCRGPPRGRRQSGAHPCGPRCRVMRLNAPA